jgi:hypothetical protein
MSILRTLAHDFQALFPATEKGQERFRWLLLTLQAIIVPITASRTSNLLRAIETLFGVSIAEWRYYTFMASVKLPWERLWEILWRRIPSPLSDGRLLLALDDSINPKTGKHIYACQETFDHAAKTNQTRYPWAQTLVTLGLLKQVHGRWSCLPLAFAFYFRRYTLENSDIKVRGESVVFRSKFEQAVVLIGKLGGVLSDVPVLVVTDSWFGNNGLFKPLRAQLGERAHLLSRLRVNAALYACPEPPPETRPGRPRKYGARLGSAAQLAEGMREHAKAYTLHLYGAPREVLAAERIVMLKTLRCQVRVVWVYRKTQWVALVTTDLGLSVEQIIEYYSARWKIEAGFREIKQEIGSAQTQTRNPEAVTNHLQFCLAATTITWIYAEHLPQAPTRHYASQRTTEFTFGDARRSLAKHIAEEGFSTDCQDRRKSDRNPLIATVMRLVA